MRILIDLDNTLNFMWEKTALTLNQRYGDNWNPKSLEFQTVWNFGPLSNAGEDAYNIWGEPGFFRDVKPFEGALDVLPRLFEKHQICIVTASTPITCVDKAYWIEKNFPFLSWNKNIVVCSQKYVVQGDILFDDNSHENLFNWTKAHPVGLGVAMASGYNRDWTGPRVKNWYEFEQVVSDFEQNKMKYIFPEIQYDFTKGGKK